AEKLTQLLERAYFLQLAVYHLMRGVLRLAVLNLDPVWLCGARLRGRRNIGGEKDTNEGDRRNQEQSQRAHHDDPRNRETPSVNPQWNISGLLAAPHPSAFRWSTIAGSHIAPWSNSTTA